MRPVLAGELNRLLAAGGGTSKTTAELAVMARVVGTLWDQAPRLRAVADKLGGTDFYGPGLRKAFPDASLTVVGETIEQKRTQAAFPAARKPGSAKRKAYRDDGPPRMSRYTLTRDAPSGPAELDILFVTGAEVRSLPVAAASALAKYTRELLMEALNAYWIARFPGIAPTKGYYVDGRRFLEDLRQRDTELDPVAKRLIRDR